MSNCRLSERSQCALKGPGIKLSRIATEFSLGKLSLFCLYLDRVSIRLWLNICMCVHSIDVLVSVDGIFLDSYLLGPRMALLVLPTLI